MNKAFVAVGSLGVGAGLMYFADPHEGRRRRARVRDLAVHFSRRATIIATSTSRDVQHRLIGVTARTLGRVIVPDTTPADDVLVARVRARVGRLVSHPHAIEVHASDGHVTVKGPVFDVEVAALLDGIAAVPGVIDVDNRLEPHADAAHVSALQGAGPHHEDWFDRLRDWTRAMRHA